MIPTMVVGDCYGSLLRQTIPETLKCSIKTAANSFLTVTADCYGERSFSAFSDNADSSVPNDPNADDMISVQSRASRLFGKVAKGSDTKLDQCHFPNAAKRIGLISRGRNFYVRLHIPRALHQAIGRKEIVRSLRTGKLQDAIRRARIVGADFESWLNQSASQMSMGAPVSEPSLASAPAQSAAPAPQIPHVAASIGHPSPRLRVASHPEAFPRRLVLRSFSVGGRRVVRCFSVGRRYNALSLFDP